MSDISPIGPQFPAGPRVGGPAASSDRFVVQAPRTLDRVEVSRIAHLLAQMEQLPEIRADLVEQLRSDIRSGDYDLESKIEKAIENLIEDL